MDKLVFENGNWTININKDCQFIKELEAGNRIALYNLAVCKGQLKMYCKGIKPSRNWKIGQVKEYFGMNGSKEVLRDKLIKLNERLIGDKNGI